MCMFMCECFGFESAAMVKSSSSSSSLSPTVWCRFKKKTFSLTSSASSSHRMGILYQVKLCCIRVLLHDSNLPCKTHPKGFNFAFDGHIVVVDWCHFTGHMLCAAHLYTSNAMTCCANVCPNDLIRERDSFKRNVCIECECNKMFTNKLWFGLFNIRF